MKERVFSIIIKLRYVIPLAIIVLGCKLKLFYYIQTDDYTMNYISRGVISGNADEHLVFIKVVLGYLFKQLNNLFDSINWFGIFYLLLILGCTYILMRELEKVTSCALSLIICIIVEMGFLCWLSFTALAYLCILTTIIVLLSFSNNNDSIVKYIIKIVISVFFICLGYAIRADACFTGILLLVPLLLAFLKKNNIKSLIIIALLSTISMLAISTVEKQSYSSQLWKNYKEYNTSRSSVLDYPVNSYNTDVGAYKKIGYSKNDYECLSNWIFADKNVFSKKNLDYIKKRSNIHNRYNLNPIRIAKEMIKRKEILLLCIIMAFFFIITRKKKNIAIQSIFSLGAIILLFIINRPVLRVCAIICLLSFFSLFYIYLRENEIVNIKKKEIVSITVILAIAILTLGLHTKMLIDYGNARKSNLYRFNEEIEYINNHIDKVFVVEKIYMLLQNEDILSIKKDKTYNNLMDLGDWTIYNNTYYQQTIKNNIRYNNRLLLSLIDNEKMVFIKSSNSSKDVLRMVSTYLYEHTSKVVTTKRLKVFPKSGDEMYVFVTKKEK